METTRVKLLADCLMGPRGEPYQPNALAPGYTPAAVTFTAGHVTEIFSDRAAELIAKGLAEPAPAGPAAPEKQG